MPNNLAMSTIENTAKDFPGMTQERYNDLQVNIDKSLTITEAAAGWHFCYDWDGLLIHNDWKEAKSCTCKK